MTELFSYNTTAPNDDIARYPLCHDFPGHFTCSLNRKLWQSWLRQGRQQQVGRIYNAKTSQGELLFFRLHTVHTPGATSFASLHTLPNGPLAGRFKEACRLIDLLANDLERTGAYGKPPIYRAHIANTVTILIRLA